MNSIRKIVVTALALALAFTALTTLTGLTAATAGEPGNAASLQGVKTGKVVFDVNLKSIKPLPVYLMVIKKTFNDLKAAGVEPNLVVAFRGLSVNYVLKTAKEKYPVEAEKAAAQLKELKGMGVVLEACNLAMSLQNIDSALALDDVEVVGNTFVSLIGYQAKGYGLIPII